MGAKLQNGHGFDWGFDPTADQGDTWPHMIGAVHHVCVGVLTQAWCAGSTGPRWTGHLTQKGYAISTAHSKSDGAGVRVGQWLAEEEKDASGAMAGANWCCRYGCPGRQIMNEGHGEVEKLTAKRLEVVAASGEAR